MSWPKPHNYRALAHFVFCAMLLCAGTPVRAEDPGTFSQAVVQRIAAELAQKPYAAPPDQLPEGLKGLDYDQYRQIRFRRDRTIWRGEGGRFGLQLLPTGWLFKSPIQISIVDNGVEQPLSENNSYFDLGPLAGKLPPEARLGFSGFRINGPLNRPDVFDEIIVFQGASYFRALSRGQVYGASARGLALNVAQPEGEEFPLFRRFWIEKPAKTASQIVIHALLDSPSATGAYQFRVTPGATTAIDVEMTLYPRRDLPNVGIAPLTSMFLFSGINRSRSSDFRPAVHDSDGLAIRNGWDEHIWRPLNNPRRLQASSFLDQNPKGFGLIQRARSFSDFQDLEAVYEKRPSVWVEAGTNWGAGAVQLIEIPTEEEIHDNIVAYWKPAQPLGAGKAHPFSYRILWPNQLPSLWSGATVSATRAGLVIGPQRKTGALQFAVDFAGVTTAPGDDLPSAAIEATAGAVGTPVVQPNPHIDGVRVSFAFDPKGAASSELRLVLSNKDQPISETWLYRWTKD